MSKTKRDRIERLRILLDEAFNDTTQAEQRFFLAARLNLLEDHL